jgi:GcrA cell cycle regulator
MSTKPHQNQYRIHSAETVERVIELWREGKLSASEIAAETGLVSRSAVISKMHQLGIPQGDKPPRPKKVTEASAPKPVINEPRQYVWPEISRPIETEPEPEPEPPVTRAPETGVTLLDLKPSSCRFALGERMARVEFFCGDPVKPGLPYCAHHAAMCYTAPPPRKPRAHSAHEKARLTRAL